MSVGGTDRSRREGTRPTVVVVSTGGTIGSTSDPTSGKEIGPVGEEVLGSMVAECGGRIVPLWQRSSVELGLSAGLELVDYLRDIASALEADGLVVTAGTDTLEELCFAVELIWEDEIPCVFTASMLSLDVPGSDARQNLADAVRVAGSTRARRLGVVAVLDGVVHSARYLYKSRPVGIGAFNSYGPGPIGVVEDIGSLVPSPDYMRERRRRLPRPVVAELPFTPIVMAVGDDDGRVLRALAASNLDGLVVCGTGAGNVSSGVLHELTGLRLREVPVVVASRTGKPAISPEVNGSPARHRLREMGCVFAESLSGVKARLLLMMLVANGRQADIRQWFEACA